MSLIGKHATNGQVITLDMEKVDKIFKAKSYDPLLELLDVIPYLEPHQQAKVHMELLSYVRAKMRTEGENEYSSSGRPNQFNSWREKSADELIKTLPTTIAELTTGTH